LSTYTYAIAVYFNTISNFFGRSIKLDTTPTTVVSCLGSKKTTVDHTGTRFRDGNVRRRVEKLKTYWRLVDQNSEFIHNIDVLSKTFYERSAPFKDLGNSDIRFITGRWQSSFAHINPGLVSFTALLYYYCLRSFMAPSPVIYRSCRGRRRMISVNGLSATITLCR